MARTVCKKAVSLAWVQPNDPQCYLRPPRRSDKLAVRFFLEETIAVSKQPRLRNFPEHRDLAVGLPGGLVQPVPDRLEDVVGQVTVHDAGLRDDQPVVRLYPVGVEHRVEVRDELGAMARRDPGQHDAERGAAFPGVLSAVPRPGRPRSGSRLS